MIELTNNAVQTVEASDPVVFNTEIVHSGCCERHRVGSSMISLLRPGRYLVMFSANVTGGTAGEISLALTLNGEALLGTTMTTTVSAVGESQNISTQRYVDAYCNSYTSIGVTNTSATTIEVDNPNILIVRVA